MGVNITGYFARSDVIMRSEGEVWDPFSQKLIHQGVMSKRKFHPCHSSFAIIIDPQIGGHWEARSQ